MASGGSVKWFENQADPPDVAACGGTALACGCTTEPFGRAWKHGRWRSRRI
jgi:hypothetical protein